MKAIAMAFLLASGMTLGAQDALVDVDFSKDVQEVHCKDKGSFDGVLPQGVSADFPGWNASEATAEKKEEGGRAFLRFNVKKFDQPVLFRLSGEPRRFEPGYYEVKTTCRTPDNPLNLHIRIVPKPYTTLCESDFDAGKDWQEKSEILHLEASPDVSSLGLFLSLKEGKTDIASIKLLKSSKEAYLATLRRRIERPAQAPANYFRNSRFPLGLQAGWNIGRDNITGTVEADASDLGPSGAAALKMASGEESMTVYSEPFQVADPAEKCQVSFAYKATGNWTATTGGVSQKLPPSEKWTTASLSFSPDPLAKGFSLALSGRGVLKIDSLRASSGEKPAAYASAGECEIALAPVCKELPGTRVQFSDEPAQIDYAATGQFEGATLKAKVANVYGEERALQDSKLLASGKIDFNVFKERPFGPFRVEVWAERNDKKISPVNETVVNRVRRPVHWGEDAPESPFGGHFIPNPRVIATMKAAGMNWERLTDSFMEGTCWGWLEPEKGQWIFSDSKIENYRKAKIKILGYLGSAPPWASFFSGQQATPYFDRMYQPKDLEAFKNYVRTVATHYKGVIDEYQFQNEPFGDVFWHKTYNPKTGVFDQGADPAKDYAELAKIAYGELKTAYPEAVMYGFNTTAGTVGGRWTKQVFDYGAYPYCDAIDYHHYNELKTLDCIPSSQTDKAYRDAVSYIKDKAPAPTKPIVMSEGNPTRGGEVPKDRQGKDSFCGLYKHTVPWTNREDNLRFADMTCRFVIDHLALGVKRVFLYSDHCHHHLLRPATFPVLLASDGYPHPNFAAFSTMAWLLEGRKFVKCVPVGEGVWAYVFEGRGGSVAVIAGRRQGEFSFTPAEDVAALDLFGNPLSGTVKYEGRIFYLEAKRDGAAFATALAKGE